MMAGFSFQQIRTTILLAALSLFSPICLTDVQAEVRVEVRVVVEYDSTGHRLVQVVELPLSPPAPVSDHLQGKAKTAITPTDAISKVKLRWFNIDGVLITTTLMDDPRLTHAPLKGADQAPSIVGLEVGAFVVSGPAESTVLEVNMPVNANLGLDQQFWRLNLVR